MSKRLLTLSYSISDGYLMKKNNSDPMAMMAAMNGDMSGQWNNPFIYLMWMMFANRFWNNGD